MLARCGGGAVVATAAFAGNIFISRAFGLHRGWDQLQQSQSEDASPDGEVLLQGALSWLRARRKGREPFYLYVHTMEPHGPYRRHQGITEKYQKTPYEGPYSDRLENDQVEAVKRGALKLKAADRRQVEALYHGEVAYHDGLLARFLDEVKALGLLESTLVIFSNDHGEELFDRGRLGHGHTLYEELIRAPLVLRFPPIFGRGKRVDRPVELVDLAPTVLDALGMAPVAGMHGLPLRRATDPALPWAPVVVPGPEWAVRVGRYKLVQRAGEARLHDLVRDPGEKNDLHRSSYVARRACEVYLGEAMATPAKAARLSGAATYRPVRGGEIKLDPKVRAKLEALGYIQ